MENDPSKKESKGKRIFKKAIRRNSKSNNSSQNSALEQGIGVSRSKSFENKHQSIEINDSAPLPTPDGTKEKDQKVKLDDKTQNQECALTNQDQATDLASNKKIVDIQENRNKVYAETPSGSNKGAKLNSPKLEIKDQRPSEVDGGKKNLKRVGFLRHVFTYLREQWLPAMPTVVISTLSSYLCLIYFLLQCVQYRSVHIHRQNKLLNLFESCSFLGMCY